MYQLGLSPAIAEVPSMSAVALGANRWASRVVVVLQLAAWSAVGIVLLQKGISSLQKTPVDVKNVTKANYNDTAVANLMMKRVFDETESELSSGTVDPPSSELDYTVFENSKNPISQEAVDETMGKSILPVIPLGSSLTPNHLSDDKKAVSIPEFKSAYQSAQKQNQNQEINSQDIDDRKDVEDDEPESTTSSSWLHPVSTTTDKYDNSISEARKKFKNYNPNGEGAGGAAAAAVAMVAVGAVMLVLGPVVIILRALDERRQERRFLKLSGQDDLPPSYEQATLMDEAPRYSTLSLNTIGCAAAPSASSAASATVPIANSPTTDYSADGEVREV